jgi:hypothetical protein
VAFLEEVLLANCHASGARRGGGELSSRILQKAMLTARSRGVEEGLALAKKESAQARSSWIERSGTNASAQASFIGRALPPGNDAVAAANIASHKDALTSEWKTDGTLRREIRAWACNWARRHLGDPSRASSSGIPTPSSFMESTT